MRSTERFPRPAVDVCMYVGASKTGKTYLALQHLRTRADGRPALIVDSTGAENLRHLPSVDSCAAAIERVWQQRLHTRVTPYNEDGGVILFEAAHDLGNCHLFIDESANWLTGRRSCAALETLLRTARHRRVTVALTTQHFSGDVPAFLFNCDSAFYVFRTKGLRARERLAEEFEEEDLPEQVKVLPNWECLLYPRELSPSDVDKVESTDTTE